MIAGPAFKIDPLGESLALTTSGNVKNLIVGALELKGHLDLDALGDVVSDIGNSFPQLKMCVKEVAERGRHHLVWDSGPQLEIPVIIWDATNQSYSGSSFDTLLSCIEPSLERDRNLFTEAAGEVHLVKLAPDHQILALVASHVAADAMTFAEVAKESMIKYHERITGQKPTLSYSPLAASSVGKRRIRKRKTVWKDYWTTCRQALMPYRVKCGLPKGSGRPADSCEYHVKKTMIPDEAERVVSESLKRKVSLVDYFMASTIAAIDHWNKARNIEPATVTAALTVNMEGRFKDLDGPNKDSALYFQFGPEERKDPEKLSRRVLRARIGQFRNQMDLKYSKAITKLNNLFRIFPFKTRQRIFSQILARHQTSFALTFMGVVWPSTNGRRITGDSYLISAGDLDIADVFAIPYKLVSRTPLYLSAYFFRKRLNVILSAAAWQFTREEAEAFLDLFVELLKSPGMESQRLSWGTAHDFFPPSTQ